MYVESRKMVQIHYLQSRNRDADVENGCVDTGGMGKERVKRIEKVPSKPQGKPHMSTPMCNTDS